MYSQNMQFIFQEEMEKEAEMQSEPFVIFVFLFFLHDAYDRSLISTTWVGQFHLILMVSSSFSSLFCNGGGLVIV